MPTPEPNVPTNVNDEILTLRRICRELDRLDARTRERAIKWLHGRYTAPAPDAGEIQHFGRGPGVQP